MAFVPSRNTWALPSVLFTCNVTVTECNSRQVCAEAPWPVRIANKGLYLTPTVLLQWSIFHTRVRANQQVSGLISSNEHNESEQLFTFKKKMTVEYHRVKCIYSSRQIENKVRATHLLCPHNRSRCRHWIKLHVRSNPHTIPLSDQLMMCSLAVRCAKCSLKPGASHSAKNTIKTNT